MKEMWMSRKLPGEVIDITTNNPKFDFHRGKEIDLYLSEHPKVSKYVIIDDDTDMMEYQMPFFVRTSDNPDHSDSLDIGYGLTSECAQQAIEILS